MVRIEPESGGEDVDWNDNDNEDEATIMVSQYTPVGGNGNLTFSAVSQLRDINRPAGTAKWTDWVTATLEAPPPRPPRGTLDWWKITGAELTYPKKNPEFTFGTPYSPVGTVTVSMNPNGHKAIV